MTTHRLVRCVPIALLVFCLAAVTARADWVDTFNGGFDQTWVSGGVNGVGGASGTFSFAVDNNILKMTDPTTAALGGAASGFGFVPAESFSEVHMSAVINPNAGSYSDMNWDLGLLARFDPLSSSGYVLTVDLYKGQIDLTRIDNGAPGAYLGNTGLNGFPFGTYTDSSIVLKFDLVGSQISGAAYDLSGTLLTAPFSFTDSTYAGGYSGVLTTIKPSDPVFPASPVTPLLGTFDNVSASSVPEPSTLALLAAGALALACWVWRRK